jgi:hypothetical protein
MRLKGQKVRERISDLKEKVRRINKWEKSLLAALSYYTSPLFSLKLPTRINTSYREQCQSILSGFFMFRPF